MGAETGIEWTDHTFNPWWGCQKISPGCANCYAETWASRYGHKVWGPSRHSARRMFGDDHWKEPLRWNAAAVKTGVRKRVFCASMADVFEDAPQVEEARLRLFTLILQTPALDWLLLTKRPQSIRNMVPGDWLAPAGSFKVLPYSGGWPANIWVGTSVESQEYAEERVPALLTIPARVRFLSCEPLLGPLDLTAYLTPQWYSEEVPPPPGIGFPEVMQAARLRPQVNWVIAGGESGAKARPMHPAWVRGLRDQCRTAGVPFFFKQWGEFSWARQAEPAPAHNPETPTRVGKKWAGRLLDGREWNEVPE